MHKLIFDKQRTYDFRSQYQDAYKQFVNWGRRDFRILQEDFDSLFKRPRKEKRSQWYGFMQESVRRAYLAKLNMVIPSKAKRIKFRAKETRRCPVRFCHGIMEDAPDSEKMLISKAMKQYPNLGVLARSKWNDRKRDAEIKEAEVLAFLQGTKAVHGLNIVHSYETYDLAAGFYRLKDGRYAMVHK